MVLSVTSTETKATLINNIRQGAGQMIDKRKALFHLVLGWIKMLNATNDTPAQGICPQICRNCLLDIYYSTAMASL